MPYDSPDAALPRADQPAPRQSPQTVGRYLSIDVLRAVAILLMIEVHAVDHFSEEIGYPKFLLNLSQLFGHMSAPLFALLTGLSYSLWLGAQKRSGLSAGEIVKYSLRRGMFVFALGFVVNILIQLPDATFDWDILALIGVSAIILTGMRNWHPGILIAICIVILLASPPLRDLSQYQSYWHEDDYDYETNLGEVLLGLVLNGYFPLLPWLAFPLSGFALGQIYYRNERQASLPPTVALLGTLLLALALLGALLQPYVPDWVARYYATGWPHNVYLATTVYVLGSAGGGFICLWILNRALDLKPHVTGHGPVLTFFRRYSYFALTAYVVHLAVQILPLYFLAWWQNKSPIDFYSGRLLNVPAALVSGLILIVVLYLFLVVLDRHKKYSLEYFMRWICT